MPPFLMLIAVAFVVLMVMFGNNPMDKWRVEQEKYGKDPLVRAINKYNDEKSQYSSVDGYKPPPGSQLYRLPYSQNYSQSQSSMNDKSMTGGDDVFRPAPEIPIEQWENPYPAHMTYQNNSGTTPYNRYNSYNPAKPKSNETSLVPNLNRGLNHENNSR